MFIFCNSCLSFFGNISIFFNSIFYNSSIYNSNIILFNIININICIYRIRNYFKSIFFRFWFRSIFFNNFSKTTIRITFSMIKHLVSWTFFFSIMSIFNTSYLEMTNIPSSFNTSPCSKISRLSIISPFIIRRKPTTYKERHRNKRRTCSICSYKNTINITFSIITMPTKFISMIFSIIHFMRNISIINIFCIKINFSKWSTRSCCSNSIHNIPSSTTISSMCNIFHRHNGI